MIYVNIVGEKTEGRGRAGGNQWIDTDDAYEAIGEALAIFQSMWDACGHGAYAELAITVATEASPNRTIGNRWPLPVSR